MNLRGVVRLTWIRMSRRLLRAITSTKTQSRVQPSATATPGPPYLTKVHCTFWPDLAQFHWNFPIIPLTFGQNSQVTGITFGRAHDKLFLADRKNNRIRSIDVQGAVGPAGFGLATSFLFLKCAFILDVSKICLPKTLG